MLRLEIPKREEWDEVREVFTDFKGASLQLEHSLVSMSRWESIWHKPLLTSMNTANKDAQQAQEELKSYIQCMIMTQNYDPECLNCLTPENYKAVRDYIEDPMTATWFKEDPHKHGRPGMGGPVLTSEYIYYLMFDCGIPKECEKWHLNRLMTLIRVIREKNANGGKKMSQNDILKQYAGINAARRAKFKK